MLIAIVGATAAGKSDLAVDLALALGGEVINADSMQLYRGMDIGTAKLTIGRAPRRPAPSARRLGRHQDRQRGRVPGARGPRHRRHRVPRPGPGAGRRVRPLHPGGPRRPGVPWHRRGDQEPARGRARRARPRDPAPAPADGRPRRGGGDPAVQRPPDRPRARGDRAIGPPVQRHPARLRRRAGPPSRSGSASNGRNWTSGSRRGSTACGRPGSRPRCAAWRSGACARAGPPPGRSATSRCSAPSTASGPWTRPATRPSARPAASPGARNPGSEETRASPGSPRART